jgi:hypothetical protein
MSPNWTRDPSASMLAPDATTTIQNGQPRAKQNRTRPATLRAAWRRKYQRQACSVGRRATSAQLTGYMGRLPRSCTRGMPKALSGFQNHAPHEKSRSTRRSYSMGPMKSAGLVPR